MGFNLFPKNIKFFEHFMQQQKIVEEASDTLIELCSGQGKSVELCEKLRSLESDGNVKVREISRLLAETFVTPIDREDIYRIANGNELILNEILSLGVCVGLYNSPGGSAIARDLAGDIGKMVADCGKLLELISTDKYSEEPMNDVIKIKTDSDKMLLVAMGELQERPFDGQSLAVSQILDRCETLIVSTERFAYTLESIGIKNV